MIVPTMTVDEIHQEIINERNYIEQQKVKFVKSYRKVVLKSNQFPIVKYFTFTTPKRKNQYILQFKFDKRDLWDNPSYILFGIYSRPEGKYMVIPTNGYKGLDIYPPHFFKRYRERIVKDYSLTTDQLIRRYIERQKGVMYQIADENDRENFLSFEKDDGQSVEIVASVSEGFCFGVNINTINIMKTIISEDMLFENQKKRLNNLKQMMSICFYQKINYGEDFFEYGSRTPVKRCESTITLDCYHDRFQIGA